jgi:hypothetical protein
MAQRGDRRLEVFAGERVDVRPIPEVAGVHLEAWPEGSKLRRAGTGTPMLTCSPATARELAARLVAAADAIDGPTTRRVPGGAAPGDV